MKRCSNPSYLANPQRVMQCLRQRAECGLTLVELMVALALGLVVTAAVFGTFLGNRQLFRQADNLSQIHDTARMALELLARDLRTAGGIACGSRIPLQDLLDLASSAQWAHWRQGRELLGYSGAQAGPRAFGSGSAQRVSGTDAVVVLSGTVREARLIRTSNIVQETGSYFSHPGVFVACDLIKAVLFQTDSTGNVTSPLPSIAPGGLVAPYDAAFWYVGNNPRGGRSLYRLALQSNGEPQAQEIASDVTDLRLRYALRGANGVTTLYEASDIAQWDNVVGVHVELELKTPEAITLDQQKAERTFYHYISLRNREDKF